MNSFVKKFFLCFIFSLSYFGYQNQNDITKASEKKEEYALQSEISSAMGSITLGNSTDEIIYEEGFYNEVAQYIQYCLKSLGYTAYSGEVVEVDGHFGRRSKEALQSFLKKEGFDYFELKAQEKLMELAEALANVPYDIGFNNKKNQPAPMPLVYGNLSNIHNKNDVIYSIKVLKNFPYIICSEPGKLSYKSKRVTEAIRQNTKMFGYINIGPENPLEGRENWKFANPNIIKTEIDRIAAMGWYGVFIDQFGYDFGETRKKQNEIVDYAHSKGLKCMANAWLPQDAMGSEYNSVGNADSIPSHLGKGDWYVLESFLMNNSSYKTNKNSIDRYIKAKALAAEKGINILGISYKREDITWNNASTDIKLSFFLAQCLDLDGWWFTDALENDSFLYGTAPDLDLGNFLKPLQVDINSTNKYVAVTDKYNIEYFADIEPTLILKPLKDSVSQITLGNLPPQDKITFDETKYIERVKKIQEALVLLGYRDKYNNPLDIDGFFGDLTISALDKFLKDYDFQYFTLTAESRLIALSKTKNSIVVGLNKIWTIKFNDKIEFDDITKENIRVKDSRGQIVPVLLVLGVDEKTIIINAPGNGYNEGEQYILSIGINVHSKTGKKLQSSKTMSFITRKNN
jgi:hypothetical protein